MQELRHCSVSGHILTSAVVKCVNRIEKYATDAPAFEAGELVAENG